MGYEQEKHKIRTLYNDLITSGNDLYDLKLKQEKIDNEIDCSILQINNRIITIEYDWVKFHYYEPFYREISNTRNRGIYVFDNLFKNLKIAWLPFIKTAVFYQYQGDLSLVYSRFFTVYGIDMDLDSHNQFAEVRMNNTIQCFSISPSLDVDLKLMIQIYNPIGIN